MADTSVEMLLCIVFLVEEAMAGSAALPIEGLCDTGPPCVGGKRGSYMVGNCEA